jgi:hypothetical protein
MEDTVLVEAAGEPFEDLPPRPESRPHLIDREFLAPAARGTLSPNAAPK